MKTKEKALKWYNGLGKEVREELSLNYFGAILLTDLEIVEMYFEEVPHKSLAEISIIIKSFANNYMYASNEIGYDKWIKDNLV